MDLFFILQILFDAVFLFGVLFLFHYTVNHSQKKKEESEILKNVQVQEIKENLQELLLTLKQLGREVSENIQEQVREAEEKTEVFKKVLQRLQKDLSRARDLAEEVSDEKTRLEAKVKVIQTAKKRSPKKNIEREMDSDPLLMEKGGTEPGLAETSLEKPVKKGKTFDRVGTIGFSSALVREVYRLVDSNMGVNEIIKQTRLSRAEVQLILNLRDNRFTTPN